MPISEFHFKTKTYHLNVSRIRIPIVIRHLEQHDSLPQTRLIDTVDSGYHQLAVMLFPAVDRIVPSEVDSVRHVRYLFDQPRASPRIARQFDFMIMEEQRQVNRCELIVGHAEVTQVGQRMQKIRRA